MPLQIADRRATPHRKLLGRVIQRIGHRHAEGRQTLGKPRPHPGRAKIAGHLAVTVEPDPLERENFLQIDHVALHAGDLLDADDFAAPIGQARNLHDYADGRTDLVARALGGQIQPGHADHVFEPCQRIARAIGMHRRQRALVTGIHRLQHVERFGAAHFAENDAVRAHAQRIAYQRALCDLALALDIGRARLEAQHMLLTQLQLGRVLDRDDALVGGNEAGQNIEQRRLAAAGTARDQHIDLGGR